MPHPQRSSEVKLASVSYVALDAISASICGTPFFDTEFIVRHQGKDESLFGHSHVIKQSCPVLFKSMFPFHMNLTCSDPEARQHQPGFYGELLPSESVRCGNS